MPSVLYAVFQEEMGGSELHGLVTSPEAALRWVEKLQAIYRLTHFDPILQPVLEESRWEALYANWEIRVTHVHEQEPELEPPEHVLLALRLLPKVDPTANPKDLPPEMQENLLSELTALRDDLDSLDLSGALLRLADENPFLFGHDEDFGWFALHRDEELLYVVATERDPSVGEA